MSTLNFASARCPSAEFEILIGAGAQEFWDGTGSDMAQSECGWNFISVARFQY
jgi:hypothetical protein